MKNEENQPSFSENHRRVIATYFKHINRLLSEIEFLIHDANNNSSFQEYGMDVSDSKIASLKKSIMNFRDKMVNLSKERGIPLKVTTVSLFNAINTRLTFIDIAAEELRARHMRGYGALNNEATESLDEMASDLQHMIKELKKDLNE